MLEVTNIQWHRLTITSNKMFFFNYLIFSFHTAPMSLSYLKSSIFSECMSPDNFLEQRPDLSAYSNVTVWDISLVYELNSMRCLCKLELLKNHCSSSNELFAEILKSWFSFPPREKGKNLKTAETDLFFSFLKDCKTTARHASTLSEPSQLHHCDLFSHKIFIFAILLRIPRFMLRWPPR